MGISTTDKLRAYNLALQHLGQTRLSSLSEATERRRDLDVAWDSDQLVRSLLTYGDWNFAIRTIQANFEPAIEPTFGFKRAYSKPGDWVRTTSVSLNEFFVDPLQAEQYADERGYLWCEYDQIYWRYVSDDTDYGFQSGNWSPLFFDLVSAELAARSGFKVTGDKDLARYCRGMADDYVEQARALDTLNEGTRHPTMSAWRRVRRNDHRSRRISPSR